MSAERRASSLPMSTRGSLLIARGRKADNPTYLYPRPLNRTKANAVVWGGAGDLIDTGLILVLYKNKVKVWQLFACDYSIAMM